MKTTKKNKIVRCTGYRVDYDQSGEPTGVRLVSDGEETMYLDAFTAKKLEMDLSYSQNEDTSIH
jgi:outer membrane lipoprotein-sorting protein